MRRIRGRRRTSSKTYLKNISGACHIYADSNDGWFPNTFQQVDSSKHIQPSDTRGLDLSIYRLEPGLRIGMPGTIIVAYEEPSAARGKLGPVMVFVDGHLEEFRTEGQRKVNGIDFYDALNGQRKIIAEWRKAGCPDSQWWRDKWKEAGSPKDWRWWWKK